MNDKTSLRLLCLGAWRKRRKGPDWIPEKQKGACSDDLALLMINDLSSSAIGQIVKVREYKSEDLQHILHEMDGKYSKRREDRFRLVECSDAFSCYVAEENSKIRGFVIVEDLGDGNSNYIVQINVGEKREGIGRELMRKVFDAVGKGGHISLCVNTDNEDSIKFFEALGFKRSGYTEGYRKNQDKHWYQLDL